MDRIELKAETRKVMGKKVKSLRRQGITPVHLYGPDTPSLALQVETLELEHLLARIKKNAPISLRIDDAGESRQVFIKEIQIDPRTAELFHIDFFGEKTQAVS